MLSLPQRFHNLFILRVQLQCLPECISSAIVVLDIEKISIPRGEVYTSGGNESDWEGRNISTGSCTFMKLRAAPSRYQALDQQGCIILHLRASSRARSPCLRRSQQRLLLANMDASSGFTSVICHFNVQTRAQSSSTGGRNNDEWMYQQALWSTSLPFHYYYFFSKKRLSPQLLPH
jgi:hypothetical protein